MQTTPRRQGWSQALYGPDGLFVRNAPRKHFRTSVAAPPVFAAAVRELGLCIPVRDAGSRSISYGRGRYLYDTVKGSDLATTPDGELVVDLNFRYARSCAHDLRWSCPVAPERNAVDVVVPGGELLVESASAG